MLRELFPRAKFIHICRHPYDVFRSNRHLARHGFVVFQLQDPDPTDNYETRFLETYREMEEAFCRDIADLNPHDVVQVRFEDVERDPMGQVQQIYNQLGLTYTPELHVRLERYLSGIAGYRKNRFNTLSEDERREIDRVMGPLMQRWGYPTTTGQDDARAA